MNSKVGLLIIIGIFASTACAPTEAPKEVQEFPEPMKATTPVDVNPTLFPEGELPPTDGSQPTKTPEAYPESQVNDVIAQEMMTFTDDLGNTLELDSEPNAIVSLSASTTEILFAIGAGDLVVGRDEYSLYPDEALDVTNVGAMWGEIPIEAILALEPDLVVAAQIISEEQVQALLDLGLQVYWQANPTDFEGLFDNIRIMGKLTGRDGEVETLLSSLDERVKAVTSAVESTMSSPAVFYELDATDPVNPWTAGTGTFIDYLISLAGGNNIIADVDGEYIQISTEELIAKNPDLILLADAIYGTTEESVGNRPGWNVITAVRNGAIYPIDPNIMSVPGPRLVDGLEETAQLIHPELFE